MLYGILVCFIPFKQCIVSYHVSDTQSAPKTRPSSWLPSNYCSPFWNSSFTGNKRSYLPLDFPLTLNHKLVLYPIIVTFHTHIYIQSRSLYTVTSSIFVSKHPYCSSSSSTFHNINIHCKLINTDNHFIHTVICSNFPRSNSTSLFSLSNIRNKCRLLSIYIYILYTQDKKSSNS